MALGKLAVLAAGLVLASGTALATETVTYKYDGKGRLIEVKRTDHPFNANVKTEYKYKKADNREKVTTTGSPNN